MIMDKRKKSVLVYSTDKGTMSRFDRAPKLQQAITAKVAKEFRREVYGSRKGTIVPAKWRYNTQDYWDMVSQLFVKHNLMFNETDYLHCISWDIPYGKPIQVILYSDKVSDENEALLEPDTVATMVTEQVENKSLFNGNLFY